MNEGKDSQKKKRMNERGEHLKGAKCFVWTCVFVFIIYNEKKNANDLGPRAAKNENT